MESTFLMRTAHTRKALLHQVLLLSLPAILSQLSTVAMQYIDTAMVGHLGAGASASVGLVTTTVYLINGFCQAASSGFSVQIAHAVGAHDIPRAKRIFRLSLFGTLLFALLLAGLCMAVSSSLPVWLAGEASIRADASRYFLIYAAAIPFQQLMLTASAAIQCSGNMKIPGLANIAMCILDVLLNAVCIYRLHMGAAGAALGTGLSQMIACAFLLLYACRYSEILHLRRFTGRIFLKAELRQAFRIAAPIAFEEFVMCGTMMITTRILAPYGAVNVAVYALVSTAEGICYMPGFGIGLAATTLVGQSLGAQNCTLARQFARLTICVGVGIMSAAAVAMWFAAPAVFELLTNDMTVRQLGILSLRIEMICEPLFAVQLVISGIFRGAGRTLPAGLINAFSMWGLRLLLIAVFVQKWEVVGVWAAISAELCVRGTAFYLWYRRGTWSQAAVRTET